MVYQYRGINGLHQYQYGYGIANVSNGQNWMNGYGRRNAGPNYYNNYELAASLPNTVYPYHPHSPTASNTILSQQFQPQLHDQYVYSSGPYSFCPPVFLSSPQRGRQLANHSMLTPMTSPHLQKYDTPEQG
eukprot:121024_1